MFLERWIENLHDPGIQLEYEDFEMVSIQRIVTPGTNQSEKEYSSACDKIFPIVVFPEPIIPAFSRLQSSSGTRMIK